MAVGIRYCIMVTEQGFVTAIEQDADKKLSIKVACPEGMKPCRPLLMTFEAYRKYKPMLAKQGILVDNIPAWHYDPRNSRL